MSSKRKTTGEFRPLKSFKPITNQRHARKATSEFHSGQGSHAAYQTASALLTDLHKTTSKFVFRSITKLGLRPKAGMPKLSVLEIGAVNVQLLSSPFLNVEAIDLNSRHPKIKQQDFFTFPTQGRVFDCVVLAMVLNCVPLKEKRGEMLFKCRECLQVGTGLLFLVLPSRCFPGESRVEFEQKIMVKLGFQVVFREATDKVFSTCFRVVSEVDAQRPFRFSGKGGLLEVEVE